MKRRCPWFFDDIGMPKARFLLPLGIVMVAAIVIAALAVRDQACDTASRQLHRPTSFHVPGGCYVGIGHGQKVPLGNYNAFRDAR